ncbi:hypothetical protein KJ359_001773 [Pestalotiopsis sp. 9143b]|nr:hypothetical protein KJ359_001773 [Pestalotiopsis sp. 9143b]
MSPPTNDPESATVSDKSSPQLKTTPVPEKRNLGKPHTVQEDSGYAHAGTNWDLVNAERAGETSTANNEDGKKKSWKDRLFKGPGLGVYK